MERNPELSLLQPGVPVPAARKEEKPEPDRPSPAVLRAADHALRTVQDRRPTAIELAAAGGVSVDRAGWVTTARADLGVRGQRLGARLALAADTQRKQRIEGGTASWRRVVVGAGPSLVLLDGPALLEVDTQFLLGVTAVSGKGFDDDAQSSTWTPGLAAAARFGLGNARLRPWVESSGQLWLAPEDVAVAKQSQPTARVQLPRTALRLLLGLSFLLR